MPKSKISRGGKGTSFSYTLLGPPEKIMPMGFSSFIFSMHLERGTISEYTLSSLTFFAMSIVYWPPKSTIKIFSLLIIIDINKNLIYVQLTPDLINRYPVL